MADPEITKSGKGMVDLRYLPECAFRQTEKFLSILSLMLADRSGERKEESARSDSPILEPHTQRVCAGMVIT